ncbi:hypothetical protein OpiT1DRAFT_01307 [Opitutaceae bacterium TAV1]|nr:hypothetical protein OpiT1DRAFT_01307 [Opitutaceae bacterium TAV1]
MGAEVILHRRPEDWPKRLHEYLAEASRLSFAWGRHDCVHLAARWLERIGYAEPLAGLPSWKSELSAWRAMRARGGFEQAVADHVARLGCSAVPPLAGQRGDIALVAIPQGRKQALGIIDGVGVACAAPVGLGRVPVTAILRAWRT